MATERFRIGLVLLLIAGAAASGVWVLAGVTTKAAVNHNVLSAPGEIKAPVAAEMDGINSDERRVPTNLLGQVLTYKASFQLEVQGKSDTAPRTVIIGNAKLSLSSVAENATDVELAALLSDITVSGDSERQGANFEQQVSESMKVPFALHVTPAGQISSIAFPPEGNEVGAGIMRGLASAFQFTRPSASGVLPKTWSINERDNLGDYAAVYEDTGEGTYKKSTRDYSRLELSQAFQVMQGQKGPKAHLEGTYQVDDAKRIKVASLTQVLSFPSSDDGTASISSTYRLELVGVGRGGRRVAGSESWRRLPLGATLQVSEVAISEKQNRQILGDGNWESLQLENLAAIKGNDDKARLQVGRRMKALFELEPRRASDAVLALRKVKDPKEAQTVLGALSSARIPAALTAIQDVATDRSGKLEVREAALGHLGLHNEPTAETLKTLTNVATTESDPTLRNQAVVSLGTVAGKLEASTKSSADDVALAKQTIAGLSEQLNVAKDPETRTLYLQSLGNAGGTDVLSSTVSLLSASDPSVRQSAIFALRFVAGDEADKLVISALLRDTDPTLRATAAQAAAFRKLTPTLLAGVVENLKTEQEVIVRSSVVECLAAFVTQSPSDVRPLLEWVSKNDSAAEVRDSATKILKSTAGV